MIPSSISISNFKSFGSRAAKAPLRPITLIFGPNSAGKSSLLQSLLYFDHALASEQLDVVTPRRAKGGMDLGGFAQILNRQSRLRDLVIGFTFGTDLIPTKDRNWLPARSELTLSLVLGRTGDELGTKGVSLEIDGRELLRATRTADETFALNSLDFRHPAMRNLLATLGYGRGTADPNDYDPFDQVMDEEDDKAVLAYMNFLVVRGCFELEIDGLLPSELVLTHTPDLRETPDFHDHVKMTLFSERWEDHLPDFQKSLLPGAFNAAFAAFRRRLLWFLDRISHVPPLRELPPRVFDLNQHPDPIWRRLANEPELRKRINGWLGSGFMKTRYSLQVREFAPMDEIKSKVPELLDEQVRKLFERKGFGSGLDEIIDRLWADYEQLDKLAYVKAKPRLYESMIENGIRGLETYARDDAYNSSYDRDFLLLSPREKRQRAIQELDELLSSPDFYSDDNDLVWELYKEECVELQQHLEEHWDLDKAANELSAHLFSGDGAMRKEIALVALPANTKVSLQDVGVGISQVLPVLMSAFAERNGVIAIEQPEIHIHPALQAELGDVFIETALGENKNTFLLETHSEHLILRLLRRIRETTEGDFSSWSPSLKQACPNGIKPEDIAVLYVQPGEEGAEIIELPVTEDGDFSRPWPGGFFAERSKELF